LSILVSSVFSNLTPPFLIPYRNPKFAEPSASFDLQLDITKRSNRFNY